MKVQFVFASLLVCSLLGELFGEVVEESDDHLLDNADSEPARRASTYDSGCAPDSDSKNIVYARVRYPITNSEFIVRRSKSPNGKVQFPQYRNVNYKNSPACRYNARGLKNSRLGNYGTDPRCSNNLGKNFRINGQYNRKIPRSNKKKREYLQKLLRKQRAQILRRLLNIDDDAEEEEEMEDNQE